MQDYQSGVFNGGNLVCIGAVGISFVSFRMLTMLIVFQIFSTDFLKSVMCRCLRGEHFSAGKPKTVQPGNAEPGECGHRHGPHLYL